MPTSMQLLINGYDFSNELNGKLQIDENIPEWGNVSGQILNETLTFTLPIYTSKFFTRSTGRKFSVKIIQEGCIKFSGFVDNYVYTMKDIKINCKGFTSVLFGGYLSNGSNPYVIDNAFPVDIAKEILNIAGLNLDDTNYHEQLSTQKTLDLRFSVTTSKMNYAELLEKLCEVTCGMLYLTGSNFYYEIYQKDKAKSPIFIDDKDWIDYPVIETSPLFSSVFSSVDVIFGTKSKFSLFGINNPSKQIDMSAEGSPIYTDRIDTALHVANMYNTLGNSKRLKLEGFIKKNVGKILKNKSFICWQNDIYKMVNINNTSSMGYRIIAESIVSL